MHCTYVADLHLDPRDATSPIVASEFTCTSITSNGGTPESSARFHDLNPHLTYVNGWQRGYLAFDLTPDACTATVRAVDVKNQESDVETVASFLVRSDLPGPIRA